MRVLSRRGLPLTCYRLALFLLPGRFRRRYQREMIALMSQLMKERGVSWRSVEPWRLAAAGVLDVLRNLPREYLRRRAAPGPGRQPGRQRRSGGSRNAVSDVLQAVRRLRRAPHFSLTVLMTLALGIAANSSIFSILNSVLFRDLPYESSHRIVRFLNDEPGAAVTRPISYLNHVDWVQRSGMFSSAAAYDEWSTTLTGRGDSERLEAATVNWRYFEVLAVSPMLGRGFVESEDVDGQDRVVILSHGLWQRKFAGDRGVVGDSIALDGRPHTIVGVLGADFEDPLLSGASPSDRPLLWRPLGLEGVAPDRLPNRGSKSYTAIARLADGVTMEQAQSALDSISQQLKEEYPTFNPELGVVLVPLIETIVGGVRSSLWILMAAVVLVQLIASVNVANLFLSKGRERRQELAVRRALGASRWALIRQLSIEGVVLSLFSGAVGLLAAALLVKSFAALGSPFLPRAGQVELDLRVVLFTTLVSVGSGLAAALLPALRLSRFELRDAFQGAGRGSSASLSRWRIQTALVVCEVSLALVLLAGAGLLLKSFWRLSQVDPGFRSADVLTFKISLPSSSYPGRPQMDAFHSTLLQRLDSLPGVESSALVHILPLGGSFDGNPVTADERPPPAPGQALNAQARTISRGYFETMDIALLRGRPFTREDGADDQPVAVVNSTLARRLWGADDVLGKRITVAGMASCRVVGVVRDVKHLSLEAPAPPRIYLLREQGVLVWHLRRMSVVVKTSLPTELVAPAIRSSLKALDPGIPVYDLRSMSDVVGHAYAPSSFRTLLIAGFAVAALFLTLIGVYGVISHSVLQRLPSIAVEMALGAGRLRVARGIIVRGMAPVLGGLALGLTGAFLTGGFVRSFLYEVDANDPAALIAVSIVVALVGLAAHYFPARRAAKVDPAVLLRAQ